MRKVAALGLVIVVAGVTLYQNIASRGLKRQVQALEQERAERMAKQERDREEAQAQLASLEARNAVLARTGEELLTLRAEVSRLRRDAEAALRANLSQTQSRGVPPPAEPVTETNAPLVQSFSAVVKANVPWNAAVVTGGWKLPSGNRAIVFASPSPADDVTQLTIQTRILELPDETASKMHLDDFNTDTSEVRTSRVLAPDQYEALLQLARESSGVNLLSAPTMTTLSGRQVQFQATRTQTSPGGEAYSTGPVVDLVPTISADGTSVDMDLFATLRLPTAPKNR